jgi:hypothetical protein
MQAIGVGAVGVGFPLACRFNIVILAIYLNNDMHELNGSSSLLPVTIWLRNAKPQSFLQHLFCVFSLLQLCC